MVTDIEKFLNNKENFITMQQIIVLNMIFFRYIVK